MSELIVRGRQKMRGELTVQGAKNAALPIIAACLLIKGNIQLHNCPHIIDVQAMLHILRTGHVLIKQYQNDCEIDTRNISDITMSSEEAASMRSSILLLGPLLAVRREIEIPYPGGCTIGRRPVNWHLEALQQMNVQVTLKQDVIYCRTTGLKGADILLPYPSVGVTENVIMAAVTANGVTVIRGAAREPEIIDLCCFLRSAGAEISGDGSDCIVITGKHSLHDTEYSVMGDRIVAGTYLAAAAATGSTVVLHHTDCHMMHSTLKLLAEMGCGLIIYKESIKIVAPAILTSISYIETAPYPGFATDMQSQMLVCLCMAHGESRVKETVFENRFKIVPDLQKMGADIIVKDQTAEITGPCILYGRDVKAFDLRGGAALLIAGLAAEGTTRIAESEHIQRGYEDICRDFSILDVNIEQK